MPVIHIHLFEGRTEEQKAELARAITDDVQRVVGSTPAQTTIIYHDAPRSNWSTGGKLASQR